jgi:hypothetical protein
MNYANYHNFYQKALIPIGLTDRTSLTETESNNTELPHITTHWLIALDGELASNSKEYYHWKVKIYPSNSEGTFLWNKPFYSSSALNSFDKAIELARSYENYSINDQIASTNLQNKIS